MSSPTGRTIQTRGHPRLLLAVPVALALLLALLVAGPRPAGAGHNGAIVDIDVTDGVVTFTAQIADPEGTHKVDNMRLVVHDGSTTQFTDVIPTDGDTVEIEVGPFPEDTIVSWRVFGGGERDYDAPLWNGHGEPGFSDDINAYADEVGGFGWVVAGPDDPNPFTTWNEILVEMHLPDPETRDDCKRGGWEDFGFANQGRCIQFLNTGKDSRD